MSEVLNRAGGTAAADAAAGQDGRKVLARHDRSQIMTFVADAHTEAALRDGLAELLLETGDMRRGGIRAAITTLQKATTPRILVVDIRDRKSVV